MRTAPGQLVLSSNEISGTASIYSDPVFIPHAHAYSVQYVVTPLNGAITGTVKVQWSNDPKSGNVDDQGRNVTNWTTIPSSVATVSFGSAEVASGDNNGGYNTFGAAYDFFRFVYTNTSGTGWIAARIVTKGIK